MLVLCLFVPLPVEKTGAYFMDWFRFMLVPRLQQREWWKRLFLDILVAVIVDSAIIVPAYFLQAKRSVATATLLLVCLIVMLFLAHKGGPRVTILSGVLLCLTCDFFLLNPHFSLLLDDAQDVIALCAFLLVVLLVSWIFTQHRKIVKQAKYPSELENIRFQARLEEERTEVIRREHELHAMYEVMYLSRDKKDLKAQLKQIAQTIADTFHFCGVRGCAFYLFDPEEDASMWMLSSRGNDIPVPSHDDERSVMWVMRHGVRVTLTDLPPVSRAPGNYLRRIVGNNTDSETCTANCSYLVPLISGEKTLAVMRLYVQESAHAELLAIKSILQGEKTPPSTHSELFSRLRDQTVNMIEQSLIERALNLRQELRKRTGEMHTTIISSVSHDFHTPLTQIIGAASGLLNHSQHWEDEATYRESLQDIVSEAEWLERIVNRMLALSRIDHHALTPERELYPIEEVILLALDEGHLRSLKQGRRIEKNIPDDVPAVELDPSLIAQVLSNLIENAIRHTPPGSPIEVSARSTEKELIVSVADRGPGIPQAEMERIFEPFYRVKRPVEGDIPATSNQGSGLGLAVCRGFVKVHGGRIWVENRENGGAIFQFTLPI